MPPGTAEVTLALSTAVSFSASLTLGVFPGKSGDSRLPPMARACVETWAQGSRLAIAGMEMLAADDPRRHAELVVAVRAGHSALYLHRPIFFFQLGKLDHCQK